MAIGVIVAAIDISLQIFSKGNIKYKVLLMAQHFFIILKVTELFFTELLWSTEFFIEYFKFSSGQ